MWHVPLVRLSVCARAFVTADMDCHLCDCRCTFVRAPTRTSIAQSAAAIPEFARATAPQPPQAHSADWSRYSVSASTASTHACMHHATYRGHEWRIDSRARPQAPQRLLQEDGRALSSATTAALPVVCDLRRCVPAGWRYGAQRLGFRERYRWAPRRLRPGRSVQCRFPMCAGIVAVRSIARHPLVTQSGAPS